MRKLMTVFAAIAVLAGCQKPTPEPVAQDVTLTIRYTLDTSVGSDMTRATDAEVFDKFYQKMKTGELVAPDYNLTFTETTTGAQYVFVGQWKDNDMITIRTGNYKVEGYSKDVESYIQDLASIKFDDEISVTASSTSITLNAEYDCFLLAFAKSNITKLAYYNEYYSLSAEGKDFYTLDGYYYSFVSGTLKNSNHKDSCCIHGEREDGSSFEILTGNSAFEKGKYYIYNDVNGSFELPKMEAGE
jgi:hypothetical protein